MERIIIYNAGIIYLSICAEKDCTIDEITKFVNINSPTGISSEWKLAKEDFITGETNSCPCNKHPKERIHYLFTC